MPAFLTTRRFDSLDDVVVTFAQLLDGPGHGIEAVAIGYDWESKIEAFA